MWNTWLRVQSFESRREQGQGLVEYALIIAFVAIMIITALSAVHGPIEDIYTSIAAAL